MANQNENKELPGATAEEIITVPVRVEEAGHYQNGYRKGKADAKAGRKRAFYESTQDGVPCVMRVREPGSVTMVPPHELTHARGYLDGYARAQDQAFMD